MTLPPGGEFVTRREVDQLLGTAQRERDRQDADLRALMVRIDGLDEHGTRGVGTLQLQISDLAKDVAKLEEKLETHNQEHQRDERARAANRKWWVTSAIVFVGAVDGPIVTLLLARGHLPAAAGVPGADGQRHGQAEDEREDGEGAEEPEEERPEVHAPRA